MTNKIDYLQKKIDDATPDYIKYLDDEDFKSIDVGLYRHPGKSLCIEITPLAEIERGNKEADHDELRSTDNVEITFYKCDSNEVLRQSETINRKNLKTIIETYLIENEYIDPHSNIN